MGRIVRRFGPGHAAREIHEPEIGITNLERAHVLPDATLEDVRVGVHGWQRDVRADVGNLQPHSLHLPLGHSRRPQTIVADEIVVTVGRRGPVDRHLAAHRAVDDHEATGLDRPVCRRLPYERIRPARARADSQRRRVVTELLRRIGHPNRQRHDLSPLRVGVAVAVEQLDRLRRGNAGREMSRRHGVAAAGIEPARKADVVACGKIIDRHKPHRSLGHPLVPILALRGQQHDPRSANCQHCQPAHAIPHWFSRQSAIINPQSTILNSLLASQHDAPPHASSGPRMRAIAAAISRHSCASAASCFRPFAVSS